ncbi:hypothetical protein [Vulcanisaeta distributa]|uniref:hypothetical protein n=1 Tax=Vulcanisaeta distributa TaxID=164451 RepID=UPI001FB4D7FB|nr:hypothetical protein [Vulcanisaeta distributa]
MFRGGNSVRANTIRKSQGGQEDVPTRAKETKWLLAFWRFGLSCLCCCLGIWLGRVLVH